MVFCIEMQIHLAEVPKVHPKSSSHEQSCIMQSTDNLRRLRFCNIFTKHDPLRGCHHAIWISCWSKPEKLLASQPWLTLAKLAGQWPEAKKNLGHFWKAKFHQSQWRLMRSKTPREKTTLIGESISDRVW